MSDWSDAATATLRSMWSAGFSGSMIAERVGKSRSAVMGKIHRLKLTRNPGTHGGRNYRSRPVKPKAIAMQAPVVRKAAPRSAGPLSQIGPVLRRVEARKAALETIRPNTVTGHLVSLLDLKPGDCKWPVGDPKSEGFGFCGQARFPGRPYCPDHCRIAYREVEHPSRRTSSPGAITGAAPPGAPVTGRVDRNSSPASIRPGSFAGEG